MYMYLYADTLTGLRLACDGNLLIYVYICVYIQIHLRTFICSNIHKYSYMYAYTDTLTVIPLVPEGVLLIYVYVYVYMHMYI